MEHFHEKMKVYALACLSVLDGLPYMTAEDIKDMTARYEAIIGSDPKVLELRKKMADKTRKTYSKEPVDSPPSR